MAGLQIESLALGIEHGHHLVGRADPD